MNGQTPYQKEKPMKHKKFNIKSLALGAFLGGVSMLSEKTTTGRNAWDYKIISGRLGKTSQQPLGQQIDKAAADGWEVVSAASDDGYPFVILRRAK